MDVRGTGRILAALAPMALAMGGCGLAKNGVGVAPRRPGTELARFETPAGEGSLRIAIVAGADRDEKVHAALAHALGEADSWKALLSDEPGSATAKINDAAGKAPVEVPEDVVAVLRRASSVSHASKGAFDLTAASQDPAHVDWKKIEVDEKAHTVFLSDPAMRLSMNGIAPGIVVDAARESLQNDGLEDFEIDGHNARFYAGDAGGAAWRAPIEDPRTAGKPIATVALRDEAIATASEAGHVLDPRTAAPAKGFSSVTVLAGDATTAHAYGVAVFAAGPEDGTALLLARGLEGVLVSAPESGPSVVSVTTGLKKRIDLSGWSGDVRWLEARR